MSLTSNVAGAPQDLEALGTRLRERERAVKQQRRLGRIALQIGALILVFGSWELVGRLRLVNPLFISTPSAIAVAFFHELFGGPLLRQLGVTMVETIVGFTIAAVAGILSALILHQARILQQAFQPFIAAVNSMPRLALAPLFVLWFGISSPSRIALVVSITYFVIVYNTYAGLQAANRDHLLLAKVLGAGRVQVFRIFMLPAATPALVAGIQLGLQSAFVGAIIGEMLSGGTGLGAQVNIYLTEYATDKVFADLLLMAIVSAALGVGVGAIEKWALSWRQLEYREMEGNG